MENISFRLPVYEGPLDLLLALISKAKVSLDDIPVSMILDQYLDYLEQMSSMNIEVTSEFIVMAAQLILLKSKMLLPVPENPSEDPRAELARRLAEYAMIKQVAVKLSAQANKTGIRFLKQPEPLPEREYAYTHEPDVLYKAFMDIIDREKEIALTLDFIPGLIGKESDSIASASERLILLLKKVKMSVVDILSSCSDRREAVVTFIALLELCHQNKINIDETGLFGGNPTT